MLHKASILKYASVLGVLFLGIRIRSVLYAVPPLPSVEDTWWGYGESRDVDLEIKPFRISVPEKVNRVNHDTSCKNFISIVTKFMGLLCTDKYNVQYTGTD